jgi:hypothetical protein
VSQSTKTPKVVYRLLPPGTFDDEAQDFRAGYAIERVESLILGEFASREEARAFMLTEQR